MEKVSITANKSSIGHCFGAAGSIESIFTLLSIYNVSPICKKQLTYFLLIEKSSANLKLGETYN